MKEKIVNAARGLYSYYSTGATSQIPYFSTIGAFVLMVLMHVLQVAIFIKRFFNISIDPVPIPEVHRGLKYLILALYLTPIYIILSKMFPLKLLTNHELSVQELKKNRNIFFVYAVLNIALMVLLVSDKVHFRK